VQQEEGSISQIDMENVEVCDITLDHSVTPSLDVVAIPKCHLQSEVDENQVANVPINVCLSFEQDQEENYAAHDTQSEVAEATMQVVEDHQQG
jgi:hypothetical protein